MTYGFKYTLPSLRENSNSLAQDGTAQGVMQAWSISKLKWLFCHLHLILSIVEQYYQEGCNIGWLTIRKCSLVTKWESLREIPCLTNFEQPGRWPVTLLENRAKVQAKGTSGCCSRSYLWPAALKGRPFGTGLKHHPVPKLKNRHRVVPSTSTKSRRRNRHRLVAPTGA